MYFDYIIVVGSGKIACDCVNILNQRVSALRVIESKKKQISMLKRICDKKNIEYLCEENSERLKGEIYNSIQGKTLIVSANNEYIFPYDIITTEGVSIINFHYSYLPDYRGMNIPTWVIYNKEPYTGITWHYVNSEIDAGQIIAQKKIYLDGNETALQIVKSVMQEGKTVFEEFIDKLLESPIEGKSNQQDMIRCYRRNQLPQDGYLDLKQETNDIIRLLRAFDYGPLDIVPKLKIKYGNNLFHIEKYRVSFSNSIIYGIGGWESNYQIEKDNILIELLIKS